MKTKEYFLSDVPILFKGKHWLFFRNFYFLPSPCNRTKFESLKIIFIEKTFLLEKNVFINKKLLRDIFKRV